MFTQLNCSSWLSWQYVELLIKRSPVRTLNLFGSINRHTLLFKIDLLFRFNVSKLEKNLMVAYVKKLFIVFRVVAQSGSN